MTLWNLTTMFVLPIADRPSSSFDPSRIGDPVAPRTAAPGIGVGGTRVEGGSSPADGHRRHPIGFAPPDGPVPRVPYRTEISFKRHHELPSASATPSTGEPPAESPLPVWQTSTDASVTGSEPSPDETPVESGEEVVPFYKREISFRRKKPAAEEAVDVGAAEADERQENESPAAPEPGPLAVVDDPPAPAEDDAEDVEEHPVAAVDGHSAEAERDDPVAGVPAAEEPLSVPVAAVEDGAGPAAETTGRMARFGSLRQKAVKSGRRHRPQAGKGHKVVGLKVGASQLAAAVVSETDAGPELLELARQPLAAGIVVDGEVRDESALASAVKAFFDEHKLPRNDVYVGLSSNRIGVRTIEMPAVGDEATFDNAVRFKAHEVLPVALHESVLDYRVLGERTNDAGETIRRILLVVAPRDQVEPYQRVADLAGIRLAGADLEALALLRAFVEPSSGEAPGASDTATVAVSIGHESSTLLVAGGGVCEFTRVFDWGGGALEDAIATALDVRPAEAVTILRHLSLSGPGRQYSALDDVSRARATDAVRQRLTPFARELVNSLQFYQTQADSLGIGKVLITGGTSHLEGLDSALHQMIGVDVSVGDPLARVIRAGDYDSEIEAAIGSMAVPVGLAIQDGSARGVDLLPKDVGRRRGTRSSVAKIGVPVAAAIPLAALAMLYAGAHGKVSDRQGELDSVKAEIAALPQPPRAVIDAGVTGDEAVRATAVASVLGGRLAWEDVFQDLSRVLPENVWLTSLSLSQPDPTTVALAAATPATGAPAPSAVSINGHTHTQPDVARLLARLATLPSLQRVTLSSSSAATVGDEKVVQFVIVADLNQTGGAS